MGSVRVQCSALFYGASIRPDGLPVSRRVCRRLEGSGQLRLTPLLLVLLQRDVLAVMTDGAKLLRPHRTETDQLGFTPSVMPKAIAA